MIELETVREFVLENFPMVKITKKGTHFHARCILCGDSKKSPNKKRFHMDWNRGSPVWQCFNCQESGGFIRLFCRVKGVDFDTAKATIFDHHVDKWGRRKWSRWNGDTKAIKNINSGEPLTTYHDYLLKNCLSPSDNPTSYITRRLQEELRKFISKRKLPEDVKVYAAYEGEYRNRFIIPVYEGNRIVYFQARRIHETMEPKYINPISEKERIILNKESFDPNKYIISTEGLIDAFMIPHQGTACLGSSFSETFLKELFKYTNKGVILFFDNDDAGLKAFKKFTNGQYGNKYRDKVKYFLFPDKYKRQGYTDLNEIITNEKIGDVYEFIISNSYNLVTTIAMLKMEVNVK